jgi:hypothetical protein
LKNILSLVTLRCCTCKRFKNSLLFSKSNRKSRRCKNCHRKAVDKSVAKNLQRGFCRCGKEREDGRKACSRCLKSRREYNQRVREKVLAAYGRRCQCPGGCGITNKKFLSIDHVKGGGAGHRRTFKRQSGNEMYRFLIKSGFPKKDYRLLCHNCNQSRGFYGKCPHELGETI